MNAHWDSAKKYVDKARDEVRGYSGVWKSSVEDFRAGRYKQSLASIGIALGLTLVAVVSLAVLLGPLVSLATLIGVVVILIGPPVWVFVDASNRQVERPFLWGMFALVAPIIGALVYLLVRPEPVSEAPCEECGRVVNSKYSACPYCGVSRKAAARTCMSCQSILDPEWVFCPYCRLDLAKAPPQDPGLAVGADSGSFCSGCGGAMQAEWKFCPLCQTSSIRA